LVQSDKIIRWGIPGWILMSWLLILYTFTHPSNVWEFLNTSAAKSLSITAILASIGVPLGYLIHELYFSFFWTLRKIEVEKITSKVKKFPLPKTWDKMSDKEQYYYIEFIWDKYINSLEEGNRSEIKARYRDRLTLIHSLGTLFFSMSLTLIFSIASVLFFKVLEFNLMTTIILIIQGAVTIFIKHNYNYHSENLKSYQGYFLDHLINES
jgi:uncharacterized membrane protein